MNLPDGVYVSYNGILSKEGELPFVHNNPCPYVGRRFQQGGEPWILARISSSRVNFISLKTGNRYTDEPLSNEMENFNVYCLEHKMFLAHAEESNDNL